MRFAQLFLILLLTLAPAASAQILNGGFDNAGGSLNGWTTFNSVLPNVVAAPITPRSGTHVAKLFGTYDGSPNWSGLYQGVSTTAGQSLVAAVYVRHNGDDNLAGTDNLVLLKIEFYRVFGAAHGGGDFLGETSVTVLDRDTPTDAWFERRLEAVAPAGTVEARLTLVFLQYDYAGGSGLIDDVTLTAQDDPPPVAEWTMIWNDEFDGGVLDASKWRVEDRHLVKNNELQYYAPDEVYFQNGDLVLRSRRRNYCGYDSNGNWGCWDYTSGLVESINRFATAYGRVEVRAKLPSTRGLWPAHWMMPAGGGWPPEIDIMELLGHEPTRVYMTHHWGTWPNVQSEGGNFNGPDFSADYHTFAIEWTPNRMDWLIDGVVRFTSVQAIPREPFYIILNTAVGGDWPGNPDGSTVFPQYHRIDYVRVYMPADPGEGVEEFADDTAAAAATDGAIGADEYVATTSGINTGLGDRIGTNSTMLIDSGADGTLNIAFDSVAAWPTSGPYGVVVYVDATDGGFASTYELTDVGDLYRRLAAGKTATGLRSDIYFAPGFLADYAICLAPDAARIYALRRGQFTLVNGAALGAASDIFGGDDVSYLADGGSAGGRVREFRARLEQIGIAPGEAFACFATLLNGDNAYRSNEFAGVAPGNDWDASNPGQATVLLKPGDFLRFATVRRPGDVDGDGDVDLADLAGLLGAYGACAGDANFDADADLDGSGCVDLADLAALLGHYGEGL